MASTPIQKAAKVSASTTINIGHIILDKKMKPKDASEIIGRAEKKLKNAVNEKLYHMVTNNFEHFVNTCRYEVHMSLQVKGLLLQEWQ